jgi:hypothetical protein
MAELRTSIEIDAAPAAVWSILADFAAYPDWNPFVRSVEGEARVGAKLRVRIAPPGGKPMTFTPTVLRAEPGQELRWLGRLVLPGIFDGEHVFELADAGEGRTRFLHHEEFRGILVPLMWGGMEASTRGGFEAMNVALKQRAEGTA